MFVPMQHKNVLTYTCVITSPHMDGQVEKAEVWKRKYGNWSAETEKWEE